MVKLQTVFCAAAICAGSLVMAQSPSEADKHFVRDAIEGGNGEVQLGQLAQKKSSSEDIRKFGQHMVNDHTKLGEEMRSVAGKVGVEGPSGTSVGAKATAAKLDLLTGDTFDKAYIKAMVKDHRDDLKSFEKEATSGANSEIKAAAKKGAETVRHHLEMAEQIAKSHKVDIN